MTALECARSSGEEVVLTDGKLTSPVKWDTGAIVGSGVGGAMEIFVEEVGPALQRAPSEEPGRGASSMGSRVVPKAMTSGISAIVGKILGLGGQVMSNGSACATGTEAIFEGYKNIILGYSNSMYVGGCEGTHFGMTGAFDAMREVLCSKFNDMPEKGSQPMGAGACGFVPGGGGGMLRLESLESALARGAPIYAELVSAYCNSGGQRDGGSMTFPNGDGVRRCIRFLLEDAGVDPKQISLINGHLTSTGADPVEIKSWLDALKLDPKDFPLIQSTKSMIGHGLGAAGAIEAIAAIDQLHQGYVHPSINCEVVHPQIEIIKNSIPQKMIKKDLEYVIKASFGFGDVNGGLLFKKWDENKKDLFVRGK